MIYERSDNFSLGPFRLGKEFLSKAVPSSFVGGLDISQVGLRSVEESPQLDQVVLDRFGNRGESFESLSLRSSSFGDTLLLSDLLCRGNQVS